MQIWKSIDWYLHDRDLPHERVKQANVSKEIWMSAVKETIWHLLLWILSIFLSSLSILSYIVCCWWWIESRMVSLSRIPLKINQSINNSSVHKSLNILESYLYKFMFICDVLRDFVPFVQLSKREKLWWRSVTFSEVAG